MTSEELSKILEPNAQPLWIDIDSGDAYQHLALETVFHFHPLAIEDTLNPRLRIKVEDYEGKYLFIVLQAMRLDPNQPLELGQHGVEKLCLFLAHNYLVSVHSGPSSSVADAAAKLGRDANLLSQGGPGRVAHLIADAAINAYFPILDQVDEFVDTLGHYDLAKCDNTTLKRIWQVQRFAFAANQCLKPQREVLNSLAHQPTSLILPDAQLYFRDVYDHAFRITESLDAYRELISDTTESYLAQMSMRLGNASKIFAAIATIAIPFLVISALYGMNVAAIPLASNRFGFWIVLGVEAAISFAG